MDSLNQNLRALNTRVRKGKKEYDINKREYDLVTKEIGQEYSKIKARRDVIEARLKSSLLKRYEAVKGNHSVVMAEIDQNRCGGCNMALASLVVQKVKDKNGVIECENCGRILYSGAEAQTE